MHQMGYIGGRTGDCAEIGAIRPPSEQVARWSGTAPNRSTANGSRPPSANGSPAPRSTRKSSPNTRPDGGPTPSSANGSGYENAPTPTRAVYRAYAKRVAKGNRVRRFGTVILAVTDKEVRALLARPCMACGGRQHVTLEHLITLSRGGRHSVGNLAAVSVAQLLESRPDVD